MYLIIAEPVSKVLSSLAYTLNLVFLLFFISLSAQAQSGFKKIQVIEEGVFDPIDFIVLDSSTLLISDTKINYPVYLLNISTNEITGKISIGQGPGELSNRRKHVYVISDEVYIWDSGNQVLNVYTHTLEFKDSYTFSEYGNLYQVIPFDSTHCVLIGNQNKLFTMIDLSDSTSPLDYSIPDVPAFHQFKNNFLRQAFNITPFNNTYVLTNEFSSIVLTLTKEGVSHFTTSPDNYINTNRMHSDGNDLTINPLASVDVTTDKDLIYSLYKGALASLETINKEYDNDFQIYLNDFIHTSLMYAYTTEGDFSKQFILPEPAKKVALYNQQLYVLSSLGESTQITIYHVEYAP